MRSFCRSTLTRRAKFKQERWMGTMEQAERREVAISIRLPSCGLSLLAVLAVLFCATVSALAADGKPNILVIWGDDIGRDNISAYSLGMMGYHTSNIGFAVGEMDVPLDRAIVSGDLTDKLGLVRMR